MSNVIIEDVRVSDGNSLEPIKIRFSHCLNPLKHDNIKVLKPAIFPDTLSSNSYVGVCQAGSMYYMGRTKADKPEETQHTYIALRNKLTNKVTLVETSSMPLFPIIQYPSSTNPLLLDKDTQDVKSSQQGISKEFVHRFGMLRGQRLYDQRERLTVKAETLWANLDDAAVNTTVGLNDFVLPKEDQSFNNIMPPRNSDAELACDVFLIHELIPDNLMSPLKDVAKKFLAENFGNLEENSELSFSSYVMKEMMAMKTDGEINKEVKERHLAALLYIECLIKLSTVQSKKFADSLEESLPSLIPNTVKNGIKLFFTGKDGQNRALSRMCVQKIVCYTIALALVIGKCNIDAECLSSCLQMDFDTLDPLVRVVGARLEKDKARKSSRIVLTIPLAEPPQPRRGKRK